ncbi:hypothetical protein BCR44DRAFT_1438659 [Catenaria anguillulae PL171]|uniref:Uncharacterized protein n=1 Tax=Catenaria anguillulae PL171 TaxID=765915 RepID=A0A1Y2HFG3_9FUNG|nr:hypothetical protein BCR44DRAFT_1438659 [Catenaria anguillulae PL171]
MCRSKQMLDRLTFPNGHKSRSRPTLHPSLLVLATSASMHQPMTLSTLRTSSAHTPKLLLDYRPNSRRSSTGSRQQESIGHWSDSFPTTFSRITCISYPTHRLAAP